MHDEIMVAARGNRRQESDMPNLEARVDHSKRAANSKLTIVQQPKKKPIKLVPKMSPDSKSYASEKATIEQPPKHVQIQKHESVATSPATTAAPPALTQQDDQQHNTNTKSEQISHQQSVME